MEELGLHFLTLIHFIFAFYPNADRLLILQNIRHALRYHLRPCTFAKAIPVGLDISHDFTMLGFPEGRPGSGDGLSEGVAKWGY